MHNSTLCLLGYTRIEEDLSIDTGIEGFRINFEYSNGIIRRFFGIEFLFNGPS